MLFENNYYKSDYKYVETVFNREFNDFDFHSIGLTVLNVFENNRTEKSLPIMERIYYEGQCSICRERCINILIENDILSDKISKACLFDCNYDIREKVKKYINAGS
ncbi:MAG: hypothetical protein N2645_22670 [Clostridia bacterium]|nr:hypothetical protein [Clostridia bacterium]